MGLRDIGRERHDVPRGHCINCGRKLPLASQLIGDGDVVSAPEPGNITICFKCGHIMVFADDLSMRAPTDEEMRDIAGDPRIVEFQKLRGRANK